MWCTWGQMAKCEVSLLCHDVHQRISPSVRAAASILRWGGGRLEDVRQQLLCLYEYVNNTGQHANALLTSRARQGPQ